MDRATAEDALLLEFARPAATLGDFELWLLHRAHRPEEFADSEACSVAWSLAREYRASLWAKAGR